MDPEQGESSGGRGPDTQPTRIVGDSSDYPPPAAPQWDSFARAPRSYEETLRGRADATPPRGVPAATQALPYPPAAVPANPPTLSREPLYVEPPRPPRLRGNRGFGLLVTGVAMLTLALLYAVVVAALGVPNALVSRGASRPYFDYLVSLPFWVPIAMFTLAMILLVVIVNRGRWWGFVFGGFFVGVLTYAAFIAAAWLQHVLDLGGFSSMTASAGWAFVGSQLLSPYAVIVGLLAREIPTWFGLWIAWRGRAITADNVERYADYERAIHSAGFAHPPRTI